MRNMRTQESAATALPPLGALVTYHGSVAEARGPWEFLGPCGSECGCSGTAPDGSLLECRFVLRREGALLQHVRAQSFTAKAA